MEWLHLERWPGWVAIGFGILVLFFWSVVDGTWGAQSEGPTWEWRINHVAGGLIILAGIGMFLMTERQWNWFAGDG